MGTTANGPEDLSLLSPLALPPASDVGWYAHAATSDPALARRIVVEFGTTTSRSAISILQSLPQDVVNSLIAAGSRGYPDRAAQTVQVLAGFTPFPPDLYRPRGADGGAAPRRGVEVPHLAVPSPPSHTPPPGVSDLISRLVEPSQSDMAGRHAVVAAALAELMGLPFDIEHDWRVLLAPHLHSPPIAGSEIEEPVLDWFGRFWDHHSQFRKRVPGSLDGWPVATVSVERATSSTFASSVALSLLVASTSSTSRIQWVVLRDVDADVYDVEFEFELFGQRVVARCAGHRLAELTPAPSQKDVLWGRLS